MQIVDLMVFDGGAIAKGIDGDATYIIPFSIKPAGPLVNYEGLFLLATGTHYRIYAPTRVTEITDEPDPCEIRGLNLAFCLGFREPWLVQLIKDIVAQL